MPASDVLPAGLTAIALYDRTESYLRHSLTRNRPPPTDRPTDRASAYLALFHGLRSAVHKRSPCRAVVEAGLRRSADGAHAE